MILSIKGSCRAARIVSPDAYLVDPSRRASRLCQEAEVTLQDSCIDVLRRIESPVRGLAEHAIAKKGAQQESAWCEFVGTSHYHYHCIACALIYHAVREHDCSENTIRIATV